MATKSLLLKDGHTGDSQPTVTAPIIADNTEVFYAVCVCVCECMCVCLFAWVCMCVIHPPIFKTVSNSKPSEKKKLLSLFHIFFYLKIEINIIYTCSCM